MGGGQKEDGGQDLEEKREGNLQLRYKINQFKKNMLREPAYTPLVTMSKPLK